LKRREWMKEHGRKLQSEGKKRTSMGAGVMTVMAITELTWRKQWKREKEKEKEERKGGRALWENEITRRSYCCVPIARDKREREKCLWFLFGGFTHFRYFTPHFLGQFCIFFSLQCVCKIIYGISYTFLKTCSVSSSTFTLILIQTSQSN